MQIYHLRRSAVNKAKRKKGKKKEKNKNLTWKLRQDYEVLISEMIFSKKKLMRSFFY